MRIHLYGIGTDIEPTGGFLHYITDDWESKDKFPGTGWANTEFRSYTFDPSRFEARHPTFTAAEKLTPVTEAIPT